MKTFLTFWFLLLSIVLQAQEICNNGIDDDGDGRIDCVDLECDCNDCSGEQANFWYFGGNAGLDFNSGSPVSLSNGALSTGEGCATMSDANGNLLFYTDGRTVWNRNHAVMTNGTGLIGNSSSTQSGVIVPHPGDRALYYVFTVDFSGGSNGFRYSIVDLSQSGGLGAVQATNKNVLLFSNTTEKIGVVKHCNNRDYWIIGHEYNNSNYRVYELNTAGFNATPNIQAIGTAHDGGNANKLGYLKPSADGKKIAAAIFRKNTVDLFDFDNSTGTISNPTVLTTTLLSEAYGIEFSLDGRYLYATALAAPGKLMQFDLNAGNAAAILASGTTLAQSVARYEYGALQMGPDGIIYVARREVVGGQPQRRFLSSVNNPAIGGIGANFQDTAVVLVSGFSNLSLPTFVQSYFFPVTSQIASQVTGLNDSLCTTTGPITYGLIKSVDECSLDTITWTHSGVNTVLNITDSTITLNAVNVGKDTLIAEVRTTCNAAFDTLIITTSVCPEICNNEIDDDGDGLIDSYDEADCPCNVISCDGPTFNVCSSCAKPPSGPISNWAVNTLWQANFGSINASTLMPTVGDLDGDCLPEVVVVFRDSLYALDGVTGQIKYRNGDLDYASTSNGNLAIADVDRDGLGDVFITTGPTNSAAQRQRIARLEYDGATGFNLVYLSSTTIGPYPNYDVNNGQRVHFMTINLGDIDGNGSVEVVIGNQVFDGNSGNLIASGGNTNAIGSAIAWGGATNLGFISTASVLVDILPDAFCANCQGLELVAGNMIYSIDIATNTMTVEVTNSTISDGFTSVADLDFDGQLDVVTGWGTGARSEFTISAWNPLTGVSYDQFTLQNIGAIGLGRIAIADLDNAPTKDLELAFHLNPRLYTYKFNPTTRTFSTLAALAVSDPSRTSVTVFDFDGDGANEVIYRDETTLRILTGATLSNVITPLNCASRTDFEYPVIVDANGDGQTEILVACGNGLTLYGNGQVGEQWVPSRKVWNQFSYFYTNINDDMTIPTQQQAQHIVTDSVLLNSFLKQYGNTDAPLPDAALQILSTAPVLPDSVDMTVQVCNLGDNILPASTPITFYNGDPTVFSTVSVVATVQPIGQNVEPGNCLTLTYRVEGTSSDIYAVINCDNSVPPVFDFSTDFPMTTIAECDYSNNMDNEVGLLNTQVILFEAEKIATQKAKIDWKLGTPQNYRQIQVERSANAQQFEAMTPNLDPRIVTALDQKPLIGDNYYRLRMEHQDGTTSYTAIRQLYFEGKETALRLLPNPFGSHLTVVLEGANDQKSIESIEVINVLGQVLWSQQYQEAGSNRMVLDLSALSAGTYWVKVQVGDKILQRKVVKQ